MRLLLAAAMIGVLLLGADTARAAQQLGGMAADYEYLICGYECDLSDGLLGADEELSWTARGSLGPGESYTYTYQPSKGSRYVYARALTYRGKDVPLPVRIEVDAIGVAEGIGEACTEWISSATITEWRVVVTNPTGSTLRRVYAQGYNMMDFRGECP